MGVLDTNKLLGLLPEGRCKQSGCKLPLHHSGPCSPQRVRARLLDADECSAERLLTVHQRKQHRGEGEVTVLEAHEWREGATSRSTTLKRGLNSTESASAHGGVSDQMLHCGATERV